MVGDEEQLRNTGGYHKSTDMHGCTQVQRDTQRPRSATHSVTGHVQWVTYTHSFIGIHKCPCRHHLSSACPAALEHFLFCLGSGGDARLVHSLPLIGWPDLTGGSGGGPRSSQVPRGVSCVQPTAGLPCACLPGQIVHGIEGRFWRHVACLVSARSLSTQADARGHTYTFLV
jgi:hypothetical protein